MTQTDEFVLDAIKIAVWSGFYGPDDVQQMIDDILEDDADEEMLRSAVAPEFDRKAVEELTWPEVTDCDRLDRAFDSLNQNGIIALHNAGYTMSDGHSDVGDELHQRGRSAVRGYCFYHGQDLERAVGGRGLSVAFGDLDAEPAPKVEIGKLVKQALEAEGLVVQWNDDPEKRIDVKLDWKRRRR